MPAEGDDRRIIEPKSLTPPRSIAQELAGNRLVFVRAYLIGYGIEVVPSFVKLCIVRLIAFTRCPVSTQDLLRLLNGILGLLLRGLRPTGLAMASGITIGGARLTEGLVRRQLQLLLRMLKTCCIARKLRQLVVRRTTTGSDLQSDLQQSALHVSHLEHTLVRVFSTFSAASLSSLVAITILQSKHTNALMAQDPLHPTMTPYPTWTPSETSSPPSKHPTSSALNRVPPQSPTLDFTLFFTVRALDTLCRAIYDHFSPAWLSFLSRCSDTLLFQLCCWRIMWCWFYAPWRLPMSYVKWITTLAEMDPRLLQLIRLAKQRKFVYGLPAQSAHILELGRSIATHMGRPPEHGDPLFIDHLSCGIVHGTLGNSESCTINVLRRLFRAWKTSLGIYLPVFTVPVLLFQRKKIFQAPVQTGARILLNSSRSAGFLASFIALTWTGVCMGRSEGMLHILQGVYGRLGWGRVTRTELDGQVAPQLGSMLAGLSVLVENKKRRGEMALYVATRALCATVDQILPRWLRRRIVANRWVSIWVERISFSISIGLIISAIVHHPAYVRGIVQGILKYAIGPDWPKEHSRPLSCPPPPPPPPSLPPAAAAASGAARPSKPDLQEKHMDN
ncbi:hypothetical protein PCASD_17534 [Puccinia coronata f. sp. avenae]|uniref:Transmembrane protein 135 N-terminal domain-containing protein n=1 Tax=Puccinia coronata f. sp. avenae TaxID=200324 RepID=A0A2N5U415_9BASI|nr:hypothetical protein PCASD_17534 [Puccinia coronata f. sp. avenae]